MRLALGPASLALALLSAGPAAASPPCRMLDDERGLVAPPVLQKAPPSPGRLLGPPDSELRPLGEPLGPVAKARCSSPYQCEIALPGKPAAGSVVLFRGPGGEPLAVQRASAKVVIEHERAQALEQAGEGLTFELRPMGEPLPLKIEEGQTQVGRRFRLASGSALDPAKLYALGPVREDQLSLVVPAEPAPSAPPAAPQISASPDKGRGACPRHGVMLFHTAAHDPLLWSIVEPTTGRPLTPLSYGVVAHAVAYAESEGGGLKIGEPYALEARAVGPDGALSPPVRVPFTLAITGGTYDFDRLIAPIAWVLNGLGSIGSRLEPAYVVPLVAVAAVVYAAARERRKKKTARR